MPHGPGKYDPECSRTREEINAAGVLLIVIGGNRGSGFSVTATPEVVAKIPQLLRTIAAEVEASLPSDLSAMERMKRD